MWSRLLAIKNHREHRLRAEINRIHAQIRAQTGALEDIRRQRVESAQRWRKHSQKTCTGKADQLHQLRSELNHFYTADLQFQKEGERLQIGGSRARSAGANIARKPVPEKQISYINCAANSTIFILPICSFKKRASAF